MVHNSNFFLELLAHPLEPLGQSGWLYARMCAGLCPIHMRPHLTLLRKTETVDGSVALGVIRKTGIVAVMGSKAITYLLTSGGDRRDND